MSSSPADAPRADRGHLRTRLTLAAGLLFGLAAFALTGDESAPDVCCPAPAGGGWLSSAHALPPLPPVDPDEPADWIALVIGPPRGTLEPCGCAGGMLGGIDRMSTALTLFGQSRTAPSVRISTGGVLSAEAASSGVDDWTQAQLDSLWMAFDQLEFDAVGFTSQELALPRAVVEGSLPMLGARPLVASNLLSGEDEFALAPSHRFEGLALELLVFLPPGLSGAQEDGDEAPWRTIPAAEALARLGPTAEPGLRRLVLVEGDQLRAQRVAEHLGPRDQVIWFGATGDASREAVPLGEAGVRGGFAGERLRHVVRLVASGERVAFEARPVEQSLPPDEFAAALRGTYRELLQMYEVVDQAADRKGVHPAGLFAGSESCKACHAEAYAIWEESRHFGATHTLIRERQGDIPALVDPSCVRCHVVGYGHESGWASRAVEEELRRAAERGLAGVGCESCHGPGATHAATGLAADIQRGGIQNCLYCHDADNDPNFDFRRKWPLIEHSEG